MKRLYKDKKNEKIAGVCSGLGKYLDIDPTIIRVAFLVTFFFYGSGILLYFILALAIPNEEQNE